MIARVDRFSTPFLDTIRTTASIKAVSGVGLFCVGFLFTFLLFSPLSKNSVCMAFAIPLASLLLNRKQL